MPDEIIPVAIEKSGEAESESAPSNAAILEELKGLRSDIAALKSSPEDKPRTPHEKPKKIKSAKKSTGEEEKEDASQEDRSDTEPESTHWYFRNIK